MFCEVPSEYDYNLYVSARLDLEFEAIMLNPNIANAYNNLGVMYATVGRNKEAIRLFKDAIKLNPKYKEAYFNISSAIFQRISFLRSQNREEEVKRNLEFLKKNIEVNDLNNVIIVSKGVWSERTTRKLFLRGLGGHSFLRRSESYDDINLDTLDNILKDLIIEKINFIKMDIEGAEIEALKGANTTLEKKTNLAISGYHEINGNPTYKAIISLLKKKGFSVTPFTCTSPNTYYKNEEEQIIYASK